MNCSSIDDEDEGAFRRTSLNDLRDLRDHHAVLHPRTSRRGYDHRNR